MDTCSRCSARRRITARNTAADRVERIADGWRVHCGDTALDCAILVNSAGLDAWSVAASIDALEARHIPPRHLVKGSYFTYSGKVPFSRLIYPIPIKGGLGTHLTLDTGGQARFGPDVQWVEAIDYAVDPARQPAFLASVRRFWPDVDPERLAPGYSGIRPRLTGPTEPDLDWLIQGAEAHGLPGLVNLFGIDSPGLTSSLAIADYVAAMLRQG